MEVKKHFVSTIKTSDNNPNLDAENEFSVKISMFLFSKRR